MSIRSDAWIRDNSLPFRKHFNVQYLRKNGSQGDLWLDIQILFQLGMTFEQLLDLEQFTQTAKSLLNQYLTKNMETFQEILKVNDGGVGAIPKGRIPLIYPFINGSQNEIEYRGKVGKVPSYGLSSYGYDIRLGDRFMLLDSRTRVGFTNRLDFFTTENTPSEKELWREVQADSIELLPHQFMLGVSLEHVYVPTDCLVTCMQKSTVARKGCLAFVTPLEPEWSGYITLEIVNTTDLPMRLYAGQGIMQLTFHGADEVCETSYADRNGKYMNQPARPVASLP